jgi:hypothetical protein
MSNPASGPPRVRASDPEREQIVQVLRDAVTEGRLSLTEGDERMAQAYGARYRDELGPLTTDLPQPHTGGAWPAGGLPGGPWRAGNWPAGPGRRRGWPPRWPFIGLAALALLLPVALISLVLSQVGSHGFWPIFPLLLLSFAVLRGLAWRRWWGWQRYRGGYRDGGYGGPSGYSTSSTGDRSSLGESSAPRRTSGTEVTKDR